MRLQRIEKLNFGQFRDFTPDQSLQDFCEGLNIVFGWNGSGKTTLSKVFQVIESKNKLADCHFKLKTDASQISESSDFTELAKQVRVFNSVYVENTLRVSSTIPYIFFAGKEAVDFADDEQKLKEKRQELLRSALPIEKDEIAKHTATLVRTVTGMNSFKKELVGRATYASYDKTDFENRIKDISTKIANGAIKQSSDLIRPDIDDLKNQLVNNERSTRINAEISAASNWILDNHSLIKELLAVQPVQIESQRIGILKEREVTWVKEGVDLHFTSEDTKARCLFCDSEISNNDELVKHFSQEIVKTIDALDEKLEQIERFTSSFSKIESSTSSQKESIGYLRTVFDLLTLQLREKRNNLSISKTLSNIDIAKLETMTKVITVDNANIAYSIESHFVAEQYSAYAIAEKKFNDATNANKVIESEISELDRKVRDLKQKVKNTHEPAQALNRVFKTVFPYRNIEITEANDGKGYALRRSGLECSFSSLSEGERNFIALAYFIHSLNDAQNKLSDEGMVIIDDPVSSLDKQSIFQIFSIIVNEIKQNKNRQYFVFTHNLDFLGHLKHQFNKKVRANECRIFSITTQDSGSLIKNINSLLRDHRSDYYYVFSVLNGFKEKCELKDAYLVINLLRRWLETFLEFKFSHTGDFQSVLESAYAEASQLTKDWDDNAFACDPLEMYRFVNHGSHGFSDPQSMDDSVLENANARIYEVFALVKILDPLHFKKLESMNTD